MFDAIAAYIVRNSLVHAHRVVSALFECSDLIVTQPRIGRVVPERQNESIREHSAQSTAATVPRGATHSACSKSSRSAAASSQSASACSRSASIRCLSPSRASSRGLASSV